MLSFRERVFAIVSAIPPGSVMTYREVAAAAGSPRAYRAVGTILKSNYSPDIPCHRVIRSNGTPGHYNRGDAAKISLLRQEKAL